MTQMTAEESRAYALLKDRGVEHPTWAQMQELIDSDSGAIPWTGHYDKEHYLVLLPDNERVLCWPNAGLMNACDGSGRAWEPDGALRVQRITEEHPRHPLNSSRRSRHGAERVIAAAASLAGMSLHVRAKAPCTHRFGLAGGFSECSACGVKKRGAR